MRNFNMNAIKDFWEDYVNSFVDTKVNLRNAKICRIDRMKGENLIILATEVDTGLQDILSIIFCDITWKYNVFYHLVKLHK